MKVNVPFELDDRNLRKIRLARGGTGKATRADVRGWVWTLVDATLDTIEEPKRRRKLTEAEQELVAEVVLDDAAKRYGIPKHILLGRPSRATIEALPDDATCAGCGYRKDAHGKMGFACPPPCRGTFIPRSNP